MAITSTDFILYDGSGVPVPIKRPRHSTWVGVKRGQNADGSGRFARGVTVEWQFGGKLSEADMQKFAANRPPSGLVQFRTFKEPDGLVPGSYVTVRGFMEKPSGVYNQANGEWSGVNIRFTQVVEV